MAYQYLTRRRGALRRKSADRLSPVMSGLVIAGLSALAWTAIFFVVVKLWAVL
jgi:hypothetical protein